MRISHLLVTFVALSLFSSPCLAHDEYLKKNNTSLRSGGYGTCTYNGVTGYCVDTSVCMGKSLPQNLCPGGNNIECCIDSPTCTYQGQSGVCIDVSACTGTSLPQNLCPGGNNIECCISGNSGGLCRSTVMSRLKVWVANKVPYNQQGYYDGYREDCSGYASMAWGCSKPGYDTAEFIPDGVVETITKAQLLPGDAMLAPGHHICLFANWTDASQSTYWAYEEYDYGYPTQYRTHPYPYSSYPGATFAPVRFKGISAKNC